MSAAWLTALSSLALVVIAILGWCARWVWRAAVRVARFLDDYFGEDGRPGVAGRPGVMTRLQTLESAVAEVRAETKPNGGTSMRDVVHRTASDVTDVKDQVHRLAARVEQFERQRRQERGGHA